MNRVLPQQTSLVPLALAAGLLVVGCGKPNKANITLRRSNQGLEGQIAQLKRQHEADQATIAGLNQRAGTVPSLEPARLEKLFTVNGIQIGRLTGGADLDPDKPGDEGFKVYLKLLDQYNDEFKSAGSFVVEAFDLAQGQGGLKLGRWEFPVEQSQANWHSFLTRYEYILTAPWQGVAPKHPDVTVRVTFTDELTGRQFTQQQAIKVNPPPAPSPMTSPATQPAADGRPIR
jgi:hypothetical protein